MAPPALLTALDCDNQVHLIVGSNPLAGARCSKSLGVCAKPILIAPANATLHYGLQKRIDEGQVEWLKKNFDDDDLRRLGRDEVDGFVDAVFVTLGARHKLSTPSDLTMRYEHKANVQTARYTYFKPLSAPKDTCKYCRRAITLHLYSAFDLHRWPTPDRHNDIWQRMQVGFAHPARSCCVTAQRSRASCGTTR